MSRAAILPAYLALLLATLWPAGQLCGDDGDHLPGPRPGDVYREYSFHSSGNREWRVTDPRATPERARQYLPNPTLPLEVGTLEGAIRAELLLDRWGGHLRTTAKQIRFNGHPWLTVPEIGTVPSGERAERFYAQDNPIIDVPLDHLSEGTNELEGTCGALDGYNWGQWGLYSAILRVYFEPSSQTHVRGKIAEPVDGAVLGENPVIRIAPDSLTDLARVDVVAWYDGYDENGDGHFQDWHQAFFQPLRGAPADIREHVGTGWRAPYRIIWDTHWVPDQQPQAIKLIARLQDASGVWFVTDQVTDLTLHREAISVRMFRSHDVPPSFGVRAGGEKSCTVEVEGIDPAAVREAVLALRTWHGWDGHHEPLELNGQRFLIGGKNHHYDYDLLPIPAALVRLGSNPFKMRSTTEHHMLEVLWPGPALLVRCSKTINP